MRVCLIHNPVAGDEEHNREALLSVLASAGHEVQYLDVRERWSDALRAGPGAELVAVAGGDGTVGKVGRVLAGSGTPLAVLPLGTANNISSMLGVAGLEIERWIAGWRRAARRDVDVGVAQGPWGTFRFLESIGTGALADSMAEVASGDAAHVDQLEEAEERIAAALRLIEHVIRKSSLLSHEVRLDGRDLSGAFVLAEVMNFGTAGPNLRLANEADASDGLLDVVLVGGDDQQRLADNLPLYRSDPAHAPVLQVHRGSRLVLRLRGDDYAVHMDDRLWTAGPSETPIEVSVEPRALTFLVPA